MERDHSHVSLRAGHLPDVFARGDATTVRVCNTFTTVTGVQRRRDIVEVTLTTGAVHRFGILDPIPSADRRQPTTTSTTPGRTRDGGPALRWRAHHGWASMESMILDQAVDQLLELLRARGIDAPRESVEDMVRAQRDETAEDLDLTPRAAMRHCTQEILTAMADETAHAIARLDEPPPDRPVPLTAAAEFSASLMRIATARAHRGRPSDEPAITDALTAASDFQQRIRDASAEHAVATVAVAPRTLRITARLLEAAARQSDLMAPPPGAVESAEQARARVLDDAIAARFLARPAPAT